MASNRRANRLTNIHRLVTDERGENYWFNGMAAYAMECLGETDYDYAFFAGLTGDVFTQHYKQPFMGDGITAHHQANADFGYLEDAFAKCGYDAAFVPCRALCKARDARARALMDSIDRGVPVLSLVNAAEGGFQAGAFVGYEDGGETLLFVSGNENEPVRLALDRAMASRERDIDGWMFIGEKRARKPLAALYRDAVRAIPKLLTTNDGQYCFGVAAFHRWADDVEGGYFDIVTPEAFDPWPMYTNFVCVLATNGSCCHEFLRRAKRLNPDMVCLDEVGRLYGRTAEIWHDDGGRDLEALGGGFNVTLETLQSPERRAKIAARIRECARVMGSVVDVLNQNPDHADAR